MVKPMVHASGRLEVSTERSTRLQPLGARLYAGLRLFISRRLRPDGTFAATKQRLMKRRRQLSVIAMIATDPFLQ